MDFEALLAQIKVSLEAAYIKGVEDGKASLPAVVDVDALKLAVKEEIKVKVLAIFE